MGMLAWFVNGFVNQNQLTPNYILIPFIVSVLALAWAIATLFSYHRSSTNAQFVALIDLTFVGALIAGVYELRFIASADCTNITLGDPWVISAGNLITLSGQGIDIRTDKPCGMLKACFAFGIMDCIFFFITAVLAWMRGGRISAAERDHRHVRETQYHRRGNSGHSHRRSGSHHSRQSSHSHHRVYVSAGYLGAMRQVVIGCI